ncbi:hypothetical protein HDU67_005585, partial [Dinochytrium kinnereticum]
MPVTPKLIGRAGSPMPLSVGPVLLEAETKGDERRLKEGEELKLSECDPRTVETPVEALSTIGYQELLRDQDTTHELPTSPDASTLIQKLETQGVVIEDGVSLDVEDIESWASEDVTEDQAADFSIVPLIDRTVQSVMEFS